MTRVAIQRSIIAVSVIILLIVTGILTKRYASHASTSCNPTAKSACISVQMTYAAGQVAGRPMRQSGVTVTFYNGGADAPVARTTATTDSTGIATVAVPLAKKNTNYTIQINATKSGYSGGSVQQIVQGNKSYIVNYPLSLVQASSPEPTASNTTPTPTPNCTPIATPASAAKACLTLQVRNKSGQPVANATINAPGAISSGRTNSEGLAGPFAIRIDALTNAGTTTYIPKTIYLTVTAPSTVAQTTSSKLLTAIKSIFTAQAASDVQQEQAITISKPVSTRTDITIDQTTTVGSDPTRCDSSGSAVNEIKFCVYTRLYEYGISGSTILTGAAVSTQVVQTGNDTGAPEPIAYTQSVAGVPGVRLLTVTYDCTKTPNTQQVYGVAVRTNKPGYINATVKASPNDQNLGVAAIILGCQGGKLNYRWYRPAADDTYGTNPARYSTDGTIDKGINLYLTKATLGMSGCPPKTTALNTVHRLLGIETALANHLPGGTPMGSACIQVVNNSIPTGQPGHFIPNYPILLLDNRVGNSLPESEYIRLTSNADGIIQATNLDITKNADYALGGPATYTMRDQNATTSYTVNNVQWECHKDSTTPSLISLVHNNPVYPVTQSSNIAIAEDNLKGQPVYFVAECTKSTGSPAPSTTR